MYCIIEAKLARREKGENRQKKKKPSRENATGEKAGRGRETVQPCFPLLVPGSSFHALPGCLTRPSPQTSVEDPQCLMHVRFGRVTVVVPGEPGAWAIQSHWFCTTSFKPRHGLGSKLNGRNGSRLWRRITNTALRTVTQSQQCRTQESKAEPDAKPMSSVN